MKKIKNFIFKLKRRKNIIAHLWQSGANYTQRFFALLMSIVLARILSPEQFGTYALVLSYIFLLFMPLKVELELLLVAKNEKLKEYIKIISINYILFFIRFILLFFLSLWFYYKGQNFTVLLIILCGIPNIFTSLLDVFQYYLEGEGHFKQNFEVMFYGQSLGFLVAFFGAINGLGVLALCLPAWIEILVRLIVYRKYKKFRDFFLKPNFSQLSYLKIHGIGLWLNNASLSGICRIDKWFVGSYLSQESLGYYNRAFNWSPLSQMLLMSFTTNPSVVALSKMSSVQEKTIYVKKIVLISVTGGILNFLFWFFGASWFVVFLFGEQWYGAIPIFKAFSSFGLLQSIYGISRVLCLSQRQYMFLGILSFICFLSLSITFFTLKQLFSMNLIYCAYLVQFFLLIESIIIWIYAYNKVLRKK